MAAFSTIALAAMTAASAVSSYSAQKKNAQATQDQGDYEAQLLERNAGLADLQATDAITRGQRDVATIHGQTRQVVGAQRTALASQGIDINDGSAGAVQAESNALGAFDELTAKNNAAREAWGYSTQAADLRSKADLTRRGARNLAGAQRAAAGNTLITGGASLASQAMTWRK